MELFLALAIGLLTTCGVWLLLRPRSMSIIIGLTLLTYAVNLLIFAGARLKPGVAPITLKGATTLVDPLPQALILTAIVISFGMTAYLVALALKGLGVSGHDRADIDEDGV